MTLSRAAVSSLLLVLGFALLAGCSRRPPAPAAPTPLPPASVELRGTAGMNAGGNAAIVRFYVLSSDAAFRRSPLAAFWQDDAAALGSDLLSRREVLLYPGETESLSIEVPASAAFLGLAADLRDADPNAWRAIFPADEVRGAALRVSIDSTRLVARIGG